MLTRKKRHRKAIIAMSDVYQWINLIIWLLINQDKGGRLRRWVVQAPMCNFSLLIKVFNALLAHSKKKRGKGK